MKALILIMVSVILVAIVAHFWMSYDWVAVLWTIASGVIILPTMLFVVPDDGGRGGQFRA